MSPPPSILFDSTIEVVPSTLTQEPLQNSTSSLTPVTRTLAIIKTHALAHRFDIERRIQEASFEIVKERQMEFDTETDPETLYELFGEDADALAEGPVWVYVLERRRAVEVWSTLMGNRDFEVARRDAPNSLRALYGHSSEQNGLMGSSDTEIAEIQIGALFASSPPFHTTDLPGDDRYGSIKSVSSSVLAALRKATEDEGYAPSVVTNPSTVNGGSSQGKLNGNGKPMFKARAIPATHDKPDIVPRTTRAAALRAGQAVDKTAPRGPVTKERLAETFANVPGHKRMSSIAVASTAPPAIAPRMTRAASLRLGQAPPPQVIRKRALTNQENTKNGTTSLFDGVPGHKRRESFAVASAKAPTLAPRSNKSAALRVSKDQGPPTSFMFREPVAPKTPALSRTNSNNSLSPPRVPIQRPASQASVVKATPSEYPVNRASSVAAIRPIKATTRPPTVTSENITATTTTSTTTATAATPAAAAAKPRPRPSSIAAPTILPRTNRSAALRAAKQEADAAAAARKPVRKVLPSSFKPKEV